MIRRLHFLLALFLSLHASPSVLHAQAQDSIAADSDPLLQAMKTEIDRSKASLKLDQVAAPYYIEYRIFDTDGVSAEAAFGELRSTERAHLRIARVVVRIGDYKQDSYNPRAEGMIEAIPLEDDVIAIRHQLWTATDQAYKAAVQALTAKQAQLKRLAPPEEPVDDFSHADVLQSVGPRATLEFSSKPWFAMLQDASAVYKDDPLLQFTSAGLNFRATNRYFVNSEGTVVRSGYNSFDLYVSLTTQASDGMKLERSHTYAENDMKALPSGADFRAKAVELAGSLNLLREAPLADEEYRGPVLFSADASDTIFANLVGENILGHKPELGKPGRTTGAFASSYNTRVLPDFLSVVDDPTLASVDGRPLTGHYDIDDEGVKAARVAVIEKGKLINYLIGREPIRDFPTSNGHGRARVPANTPGPSLGNMIVSSSQSSSPADLQKKLIELCQQRDLPYGYYVETFGPQLTPRLLYKVWVKDGHKELVRGGAFGDLDARALRNDVVAAGVDVNIENRPLNVPHSIVSPPILFDELEVKRANTGQEKLPEYPAPALAMGK